MSEYWKSTPKYWCKHCTTYVKDTPFERKQHESTGKHQGNLKRFLRGIQNEHEQSQRDKERAKAEVDRLNKVVGGVASGATSPSVSQTGTAQKSATGAPTAADQQRQWAQLAEMGIEVPSCFRAELAMPGQWEASPASVSTLSATDNALSKGVRKRKLEGQDEEEEQEEEKDVPGHTTLRQGWGSTTRRYPGQDDTDLDALLNGSIVQNAKHTKPEPLSSPKALHALDSGPELGIQKANRSPVVPKIEHGDDLVPLDDVTVEESTSTAKEDVGSGDMKVPGVAPASNPTPVFKKRKARSQASTAVKMVD